MTSNNPIPAELAEAINTLHAIARRIEAGEVTGVMLLAIEPDGSAVRHLMGSAMADRHHAAGMALQLAHDVLRTEA